MNATITKKIKMECPICGDIHEIDEMSRTTTTIIKGEKVTYNESFYYCAYADEDENEFEIGDMINENLMNARNAYRIKKGLLTSHEIVEIRESYGLSQVDLARLLGWGEATISRYESKAIQDEAYDNMLRMIKNDPLRTLEFLEKNGEKFSKERKANIKRCIQKEIKERGREFSVRQSLKCDYVIYDDLSDKNGYTLLNIDKVESVISYYAEKLSDLYKEKMLPMLWYTDAMAYKQYQKAITGLVYLEKGMGVVPVGLNQIMSLDRVNVKEEESVHGSRYVFAKHKDVDQSCLDKRELEILNQIVKKFRDYSVQDMTAYMHEESAHKETLYGDIISFDRAREIRNFG